MLLVLVHAFLAFACTTSSSSVAPAVSRVCKADDSGYGPCDCPDGGMVDATADAKYDAPMGSDSMADSLVGDSAGPDAGLPIPACSPCPHGLLVCTFPITGGTTVIGPACIAPDEANTPAFGCGTCQPCVLAHAVPKCVSSACAIATCDNGWADCDGNPSNGCEADLSLPQNCAGCTTACTGSEVCTPTGCAATCPTGFISCSGACRNPMSDPQACGNCTTNCGVHGSCSSGNCGTQACDPNGYDPSACGPGCFACPSAPDIGSPVVGGACNAGTCELLYAAGNGGAFTSGWPSTVLVQFLNNPQGIAVDGVNVFYSESGIWQVSASGGAPQQIAPDSPRFIALDSSFVYWNAGSSIRRVAKGGGPATTIVTSQQPALGGVAVDSTNVYWVSGGAFYASPKDGSGSPNVLATGIDAEAGLGCNAGALGAPWGPVLGAGTLAYSQNGTVWTAPVAGRSVGVSVCSDGVTRFNGPVAAQPSSIWSLHTSMASSSFGEIAGGTGGTTLGALGIMQAEVAGPAFAVDSCAIYFAYNNGVARVLTSPDMWPQQMATGNEPNQIALDDSFVYWTDRDSVRRVAK